MIKRKRPAAGLLLKTILSTLLLCPLFVISQQRDTLSYSKLLHKSSPLGEKKARYAIYTVSGEGKLLNYYILERHRTRSSWQGQEAWQVVQHTMGTRGVDADTSVFLSSNLAPLLYRTHIVSEGHREHVSFKASVLTARIEKKDSFYILQQPVLVPAYSAVVEEDIIESLPLSKGYAAVIPMVNPGVHFGKGLFYKSFRVTGDLKVATPAGIVDCWKLVFEMKGGHLEQWISKKEHALIRQEFTMPGGLISRKERLY